MTSQESHTLRLPITGLPRARQSQDLQHRCSKQLPACKLNLADRRELKELMLIGSAVSSASRPALPESRPWLQRKHTGGGQSRSSFLLPAFVRL